MGNCLRGRRRAMDVVLMADDSSPVAIGQNQPLSTVPEVWKAEIPMTEGQLRGKRDTFWETAPAYDGCREIWDALKAACEAVESGDYELAQAIVAGANISLPTGRLVEAYDELGNRYVVPKFCISKPMNMVGAHPDSLRQTVATENEDSQEADSTSKLLPDTPSSSSSGASGLRSRGNSASGSKGRRSKTRSKPKSSKNSSGSQTPPSPVPDVPPPPLGDPIVVKVRLSTHSKDIKMTLQASDRVQDMKQQLATEHDIPASRLKMLYSGRVLNDRSYLKNLNIPKGFLIQAIVT